MTDSNRVPNHLVMEEDKPVFLFIGYSPYH